MMKKVPPPRLIGYPPRFVAQLERRLLPDELRLLQSFRSLPPERRVLAGAMVAALTVNTEPAGWQSR